MLQVINSYLRQEKLGIHAWLEGYPWKTMLSAQDRQPYEELFKAADTERKGILLKDEAMEFFKKSEVPVNILNQASSDNSVHEWLMHWQCGLDMGRSRYRQEGVLDGLWVLCCPENDSLCTKRQSARKPCDNDFG